MFLRDNQEDGDFSAFMSIRFYEEQKHALVLMEYLRRFRPALVPSEEKLQAVRFEFDRVRPWRRWRCTSAGRCGSRSGTVAPRERHTEPVIRHVYELIARDEARHAGALPEVHAARRRAGRASRRSRLRPHRRAHGGGARGGRALHPTNLHVNKGLYPRDTVQSRLPDPGWSPWLDAQIRFDRECEQRVSGAILRNLSSLAGESFETVRDSSAAIAGEWPRSGRRPPPGRTREERRAWATPARGDAAGGPPGVPFRGRKFTKVMRLR